MKDRASLQAYYRSRYCLQTMIDTCPSLREVLSLAQRIVDVPTANVLVTGDTGTGKDTLAKCLHYSSEQWAEPFVEINCAALTESLLESELFGHEEGSFTGAKGRKRGLLEIAGDGTVYLNEIAEMAVNVQAKLLSAIEDRRFFRVGGTEVTEFSARIISATNQNLQSALQKNSLRRDLYYRLNTIQLFLPSLCERQGDLEPLAERLVADLSEQHRRLPVRKLSGEVVSLLRKHSWPGNVRELKQVIERAVILSHSDKIEAEDIHIDGIERERSEVAFELSRSGEISINFPREGISLEEVERVLLEKALEAASGVQSQAAKLLRISRDTLRYRLQKHGLPASKSEELREP